MPRSSHHHARRLSTQAVGLAFAVPQVMYHRIARMATAGFAPNERDRREFSLMGAEKWQAAQEAWLAMAAQAWVAQQQLAQAFLRAGPAPWLRGGSALAPLLAQWQGALLGIAAHGVAPVHARAVANAKRLAHIVP